MEVLRVLPSPISNNGQLFLHDFKKIKPKSGFSPSILTYLPPFYVSFLSWTQTVYLFPLIHLISDEWHHLHIISARYLKKKNLKNKSACSCHTQCQLQTDQADLQQENSIVPGYLILDSSSDRPHPHCPTPACPHPPMHQCFEISNTQHPQTE